MAKRGKKKPELENSESRGKQAPKLKDLVRKITPQNRYDEISVGSARGKERVEW
jgi:hypothetical protein